VIRHRGRDKLAIFTGIIASGDTLVKDPVQRDRIGKSTGALAIEMEGAGLAEAAHGSARQWFLVRGLVDYCDTHKNDVWHGYAAAAAAAVTVTILSMIKEN
jgi:nucleoside phosphorylase